jgi:hypothetical protein
MPVRSKKNSDHDAKVLASFVDSPPPQQPLDKRREFADWLGVSLVTVARWQRCGLPIAVSRGRVVRIDRAAALLWLGAHQPARRLGARGRPRNVDRGKQAQ